MQNQSDSQMTPETGREYDRTLRNQGRDATGAAADLYAPVPGDDNETRPGLVDSRETASVTERPARYTETTRTTTTAPSAYSQRDQMTTTPVRTSSTPRRHTEETDSGIMQKIQDNPLIVVAAATAGGLLVGRMMRNRSHQQDAGYLRTLDDRNYQGYQRPAYYQPYQGGGGDRPYPGYPTQGSYQGAPEYRADQNFQPEQAFQGRHENFPGGSNWD
jgi:hypothetical protein